MKKLIVVIAMCLPLVASARSPSSICLEPYQSCPQPFEFSEDVGITEEQALEIATQAAALAWEGRPVHEGFKDVAAWLASCEHIISTHYYMGAAPLETMYQNEWAWRVSYTFDEQMLTIHVLLRENGQVVSIMPSSCGLNYCLL